MAGEEDGWKGKDPPSNRVLTRISSLTGSRLEPVSWEQGDRHVGAASSL